MTEAVTIPAPRPLRRVRVALILLSLLSLVTAWQGARAFYGLFYVTVARVGPRDPLVLERNLRRALEHDPAAGRANVELARLLNSPGSYGAALDHLRRGMLTFRPISSYLQLGLLLHRIGNRTDEAKTALEAAVRMNPGNIRAMEQLAIIAISEGDSKSVERWTDAIRYRDFSNLNALYLRARDAERLGNLTGARTLYQQISSLIYHMDSLPAGTLFSREEIQRQLGTLSESEAVRQ
jgi:Tfp pilus assembly protein PilF